MAFSILVSQMKQSFICIIAVYFYRKTCYDETVLNGKMYTPKNTIVATSLSTKQLWPIILPLFSAD